MAPGWSLTTICDPFAYVFSWWSSFFVVAINVVELYFLKKNSFLKMDFAHHFLRATYSGESRFRPWLAIVRAPQASSQCRHRK